jgi:hypothetical protein
MEHERINFEDHLSFKEIARAWSKVPGDKPEMLMGALVSAFWRGEFESHTQSALFSLGKPPSASFEWSSLCVSITAPFQIVGGGQRRPGDYVISGGAIKKVGEDLESDETAERNLVPTFREHVCLLL